MRAILLFLVLILGTGAAAPQQFDPFQSARIQPRLGAQVPIDMPLVDQNGRPTSLRALSAGKPLLLVPVLHECPNLCGVTLAGLMAAVRGQDGRPGRDFAIVAFGIDPREGPAQARDNLQRLRKARPDAPVDQIAAVTAPQASLQGITGAIGYRYAWDPRIGQFAHAAATAVLTPDGRLSSWLYGVTPSGSDLARALSEAQASRSGSVMQQLILLCYHFDPATGRYSLLIDRVIKLAGLLTVGAIGLLIVALTRRRRRVAP